MFFFIATNTECTNTMINWTCPGGYIQVLRAMWTSVTACMQQSVGFGDKVVTTQMQNKCENKTSCEFTVTDSNFNVSCEGKCSGLIYAYMCVRKSFVLRIFVFIIFSSN